MVFTVIASRSRDGSSSFLSELVGDSCVQRTCDLEVPKCGTESPKADDPIWNV